VARAASRCIQLGAGLLLAAAFLTVPTALAAGTQYVDCGASPSGPDGSLQHPWTTLADASVPPLTPGSQLLLKRGTFCDGTLAPTGSGSAGAPALIGAYGSGALPQIVGGGEDAVRLENTSHTVLEDLEITNPADNTDRRRGVHLLATGETVTGLTVRELQIHDVDGNLETFFGGSGGIQADASYGPGVGRFDGLSIESSTIEQVSREGIYIDGVSAGDRPLAGQPWPEASTNVRITGNRIAHLAGDGIVTLGTDGALVSNNVVSDGNLAGRPPDPPADGICNAGIWTLQANRTTIEHNEVFAMNLNGCDGTGFDIDRFQDGTVVQYNYSHDNGGGFLLLCTEDETRRAQVRFNLSVDDRFMLHSVPCASSGSYAGVRIYNNTIVAPDPGFAKLGTPSTQLYGPPSLTFFNNVVDATGTASGFECAPDCLHNLFWRVPPVGTDYVTGDPRFLDPSRRGTPDTPQGFRLLAGSPALGAGAPIPSGVRSDYFGNPIDRSAVANIGFDQGKPTPIVGSAAGAVAGAVAAAPELRDLSMHPRRFRPAGGHGASVARRRGSNLTFVLDSAATVDFTVLRITRKARRNLRRSARRKRVRRVGAFALAGQAGRNRHRFTGRIHHRPLRPGRYRLRAVAARNGLSGAQQTVGFRVSGPVSSSRSRAVPR